MTIGLGIMDSTGYSFYRLRARGKHRECASLSRFDALEERNVRHVFTRILEKAQLRQIRIHDLRHTFASFLLQQGESIVYVKEQLGHASIQITVDTYGHLIPGANRAAADKLDDVPAQPDATPAQPEAASADQRQRRKLFGMRSEPRWNRTINPQIKSLLLCQLS